jgi:hypothetical protein
LGLIQKHPDSDTYYKKKKGERKKKRNKKKQRREKKKKKKKKKRKEKEKEKREAREARRNEPAAREERQGSRAHKLQTNCGSGFQRQNLTRSGILVGTAGFWSVLHLPKARRRQTGRCPLLLHLSSLKGRKEGGVASGKWQASRVKKKKRETKG